MGKIMRNKRSHFGGTITVPLFTLLFMLYTQIVFADTIQWTDWVGSSGSFGFEDAVNQTDSAQGVMSLADGSSINVTYEGNAWNVHTSGLDNPLSTSPWTLVGLDGTVYTPYTGNTVIDNAPLVNEEISLQFTGRNTLTFDSAVIDPVIALKSLGNNILEVSYEFDSPFVLLSGANYSGTPFVPDPSNTVISGYEFNGAIQFIGSYTSLSWNVTGANERRHYFNIGTAMEALATQSVPEPTTLLLMGTGLVGLLGVRRKKK